MGTINDLKVIFETSVRNGRMELRI